MNTLHFISLPYCLANIKSHDSKLGNLEKGLSHDKAAPLLDRLIFDKVSHYRFPILVIEYYNI